MPAGPLMSYASSIGIALRDSNSKCVNVVVPQRNSSLQALSTDIIMDASRTALPLAGVQTACVVQVVSSLNVTYL